MKRLFTYILALSLLPQITSAAVVVGKTEGTFAVSPKGAATYTIPLTIQKGMSDFKPELSLVYDSNAESGIMGQGWSIKGMHAITKVPKCIHFDGTNQGTAYALDGMRMILGNGVDGQIGALYKTEHDQGDIISITAAQNGTPTTFKVKANDGSIYKYGSSTGRYINGNNSKWALDYAQDALGNYISYTYDQNGGLYPTSITYGRNIHGTAGVDCTILFTYDSSTPKRLTKITCKYNGNIYRSYTFNYADSPLRLISVTEGGTGTSAYAPTTFEWAQNRISSITDGLGARESFSYGVSSGQPVINTRTESISTDSITTTYSYGNSVIDNEGKGFIGFQDITENSSTGLVTETHYDLDTDYYVFLTQTITQRNARGETIRIDENGLYISGNGDCSYTTISKGHASEKPLEGFREVYGESIEYQFYDDGLVSFENVPMDFWVSPNDTVWIKGLPQMTYTFRNIYNEGVGGDKLQIVEDTYYERNPVGQILSKEKGRDGWVNREGYTYNEYGQVTRHWTVAYESTDTLVTTYEYDTYGRLRHEYNPLGQCKTFFFNAYGMLAAVRDFDCITNTTYTYDGMLRETKKNHPTTTKSTTRRSTSNYGGSVYNIIVTETGKAPITTYYDAWDRKIAESHPLATGGVMYTDYQYYPHGKIKFVSFPHKRTESESKGTTYYYDDTFRLIETRDYHNKTNTWTYYDDHTIESCINGVSIKYRYYAPNKLSSIEGPNGESTFYVYNVDGNILKADTSFGSGSYITNYYYDSNGRLVKIIDGNGVTKHFTYDKNGYPLRTNIDYEFIDEVDDEFIEKVYDKYGRLMSKSWTGADGDLHNVTYTYNTAVRKKHLVAKEEGDNYTYTYTYDNNGRLTGKRYSVTSNSRTESANISIQYNTDKLISRKACSVAYASITEDFTYKNGVLLADTLNGYPVMRITKQDNWGNPTEEKMFFGTTTRTFDDYGHMLSMNHTGETPRNYSIGETYSYDIQTGNMNCRNGIPLTYDSANRLTGWGNHTYSYDERGNITNQPLVGEYTYNRFRVDGMVEAEGYTNDDSLSITYYDYIERPKSIKNQHYKAEFSYDGDGNRILMEVYKKVRGQFRFLFRRFYLGTNAEVTIDSLNRMEAIYYAGDDPETAPAAILIDGYNNPLWPKTKLCQIYRDNTGNALLYEDIETGHWFFNYSPWGIMAHPYNGTLYMPNQLGDYQVYRTYKGFENLWMFGLLLDKTRLYDPYIGRYLSPDPTYGTTSDPFDFNPYIFSKNNPFRNPDTFSKNNSFPNPYIFSKNNPFKKY